MEHKTNLLKSIKEQADKDVQHFRSHKEAEYAEEYKRLERKINDEAQESDNQGADLGKLQADYSKNKEQVIDLLVKNVLTVNLEIPKVLKGEVK
eukprot:CAMPEP_0202957454 /NCGR_PEP_ID=MMETSP1396-20130829/1838_1 /ASSEMBLY_ACC=CAM_ASM_000872 /TAXON_ID= /ORGANISM="Pseudokeronopsis sp., Strain Brazil" /LENGTH=93 /DNA_ID=CAMNT_0049674925 /DNA_START=80 /DNA_END=361 /DNA_ORIENTATION=-